MIKTCKFKIIIVFFITAILMVGISIVVAGQANYIAYADEGGSGIELTITDVVAPDHIYDAKGDTIELKGGELVGVVDGDDVGFVLNKGHVLDNNVSNNVPVVTSIELTGNDANKYHLVQPNYITVNIVPLEIKISGVYAPNHVYDSSNIVNLSGGELVGILDEDMLNVSFALNKGIVSNGDVQLEMDGTYKSIPVSTSITLQGDAADNYILKQPVDIEVTIEPAELTIQNILAVDHIYDGNTVVELSGGELVGVCPNDSVSFIHNNGVVASKNIGQDIAVSTNIVLSGEDAGNYTLKQPTDIKVNIIKKPITIIDVVASNRYYDGTAYVELTGGKLSGVLDADKDKISFILGRGLLNNKAASDTLKNVFTAIELTGEESINYALTQPTDIKVRINYLHVSVTNVETVDKIYDGTRNIAINGGALEGVISGDQVRIGNIYGLTDNKDVCVRQGVTVVTELTGVDAQNYVVDTPTNLYVSIFAKAISLINVKGENRAYDGTNIISLLKGVLEGVIVGDEIEYVVNSATIPNKQVGQYAVNYDISLVGADAKNYVLESKNHVEIEISRRELTVEGVQAVSRTYDGTNKIVLQFNSLVGVVQNDDVSLGESLGYANDKNVGTNKSVTTDFTLIGIDKTNYIIRQQTLTVDVMPKEVKIINVIAENRQINDGCVVNLCGGEILGKIPGDNIELSLGVGRIANKTKGEYVVDTNIEIIGSDATNYIYVQPDDITVKIFSRDLDISNTAWMIIAIIALVGLITLIGLYIVIKIKKNPLKSSQEVAGVPLEQISEQTENDLIVAMRSELETIRGENDRLNKKLLKSDDTAFQMVRVMLPFIEKMLFHIHSAEDAKNAIHGSEDAENIYFRVRSIKSAIDVFLAQTIQVNGIEMKYSEFEAPGCQAQDDMEIFEMVYTPDSKKDNTVYRTICPGVRFNGQLLIHEKVSVWQFKKDA